MNVILVGCGRMGGAMLKGWIKNGLSPESIIVIEPIPFLGDETHAEYGVTVCTGPSDIDKDFIPDIVLFAIKPQVMADIVPPYAKIAGKDTVFASIAAGQTINKLEHYLGSDKAVIRIMPNLPATIGRGTLVACPNTHVTGHQKRLCNELLETSGYVFWIDDETHMDAVTAISGSGPAYIFYYIECLIDAGVKLGLPFNLAESIAYTTVYGSGELAALSDISATDLREQVTSPNGTTQAALDILMTPDGLHPLIEAATKAAYNRSKELGK